jgi:hypothetical protein
MSVRIVDHSAALKQALYAHLADNLTDAIGHYHDQVEAEISVAGPPPSTPGNPPHMDTQYLHDKSLSTQVDRDELVAREGSDAPYAVSLEVGPTNRPFFIPVLIRESDEIARRICAP